MSLATKPPPQSPATLDDLERLPKEIKGEIIEGTLYTQARPSPRHQEIATALADDLYGPFRRGRGGPGGWWILVEPGIQLPGSPEFSPDLGGWRRSRMERLPQDGSIVVVPDWICEIHSGSTRGYDLVTKRGYYARIGVGHLWYVDPDAKSLVVSRLVDGHWLELGVFGDAARVRAEPFEDVEIDLSDWWNND
jgi:Uma2 family endonuclease